MAKMDVSNGDAPYLYSSQNNKYAAAGEFVLGAVLQLLQWLDKFDYLKDKFQIQLASVWNEQNQQSMLYPQIYYR